MDYKLEHLIGENRKEVGSLKVKDLGSLGGTSWVKIKKATIKYLQYKYPEDYDIKVLDLGCGRGHTCYKIKKSKINCSFTGVDIYRDGVSDNTLKLYKEIYIQNLLEFLKTHDTSKYDVITFFDVLEHIPESDAMEFLNTLFLNTTSNILISTPNWRMPQHGEKDNPLEKHVSFWDMDTMLQLNPEYSFFSDRGEALYVFESGGRDLSNWNVSMSDKKKSDVPELVKSHNYYMDNLIKCDTKESIASI